MDFRETLQYLYNSLPVYQRIGKAAYKANLDNTYALDDYFGHPHRSFRSIHIAGTNGKGSVSHMLASIMAEAGYTTGLYTSPHLREFTERIKVNGIQADQDYIVSFVEKNRDILERLKPSFFEMTVAMAFDYFALNEIDVAIIETGMGGRLDSTNIITPELSVITNIGLDHTQFLGPDLLSIGGEKAGIIKKGVPVVIGESDESLSVLFSSVAKKNDSKIFFAEERYRAVTVSTDYRTGIAQVDIFAGDQMIFDGIRLPLAGKYQEKNLQTVMQSLEVVAPGFGIEPSHIRRGLEGVISNTSLEGRWQVIKNNPLVICDTAHNGEGLKIVLSQLQEVSCRNLRFVIGFVSDKDVKTILRLFPAGAVYYFARSSVPRSMDENDLKSAAAEAGLKGKSYSTVASAYRAAIEDAEADDLIYVGGSTFVVADLLNLTGS